MSLRSLPGRMVDGAVRVYQRKISRGFNAHNGSRCTYTPTCSQYMRDAIRQDGVLAGSMEGLMRLQRCKNDVAENRMRDFAALLLAPQAEDRIVYANEEAHATLHHVQDLIGQTAQLANNGHQAEAAALQQQWSAQLKDELHVTIVDRPGRPSDEPSKFLVSLPYVRPAEPQANPRYRWLRSALGAVTGTVGAVAGAATGIAVLGGMEALAAATVLAPVASSGKTDAFNGWLARKYGSDTVLGIVGHERRAGKVGYEVNRFIQTHLHSNILATAVACPIGIPAGVVACLWHGASSGAQTGWQAGRVLGRSLVGAPCDHAHTHDVHAQKDGVNAHTHDVHTNHDGVHAYHDGVHANHHDVHLEAPHA